MVDEDFKLSEGILPLFNMNLFHTKTLSIQLREWADVLPRLKNTMASLVVSYLKLCLIHSLAYIFILPWVMVWHARDFTVTC